MKLEHPKSWYEKNSEAEGDSEIGAGILPGTQVVAHDLMRAPSGKPMGPGRIHTRRPVKVPLARSVARRTAKDCCHA